MMNIKIKSELDSGGACTAVLSTHSPESCLPLTGLRQVNPVAEHPPLTPVSVGERRILFEAYEFARNARKLFVFRCFWPNKLSKGQPNYFLKVVITFLDESNQHWMEEEMLAEPCWQSQLQIWIQLKLR